ncbi:MULTISPECIES: TlpA family protein disulfide reductase [Colwellia]|uniref:Thioredoxin n=1 Tax=Colwellia marinimaniae TaxID=1513592 RepID=A0ABQ0MXJ4_9GAMM|nr:MULTISPECIES: TlpA disulfide reductase family protein [Colwellia]GAW97095.1 thioredoxin [Colwellia marinimaniae]
MKTIPLVLMLSLLPINFAVSHEIGDTISKKAQQILNIPAGKVGVVDFFASWCASCAKEIPDMKKFIKADTEQKTYVIGIDVDEELEEGLAFQQELAIDFPVINDTDQSLIAEFSPIGMPALYYVIDNKIVGKRIGAVDNIDEKIKDDLAKLKVII